SSLALFLAAGEAIACLPLSASASTATGSCFASTACGASSAFGCSAGASTLDAEPFSSSIAITCPTSTLSPGWNKNCLITPVYSLLISTFTLSVSSSAIDSPLLTTSPSFFNQSTIVPSVMDSANSGTLISIIADSLLCQ